MGLGLINIQPLNQPPQFTAADFSHLTLRPRPQEFFLFQPLVPQTKSIPIPIQYLQYRSPTITKYKQVTGEGIMIEMFGDQYR
jgi:hypothetical protein